MYFLVFVYNMLKVTVRLVLKLPTSLRAGKLLLQTYEKKYKGKFDIATIRSINRGQSYSHVILNDSFMQLVGRNSSDFELENNIMYFTLMILSDTLLDQKKITIEEINSLFYAPHPNKARNFEEAVLIDIHLKLLERVKDKEAYKKDLGSIHKMQINSLQQFDSNASVEKLYHIEKEKGGYTFLVLIHYLGLQDQIEIANCLYELGGVIQMMDDILDIHQDLLDGVYTFANRSSNYKEIKILFEQQVSLFKQSIHALPFRHSEKQRLSITFSIISAVGSIAIENLKRLQAGKELLPNYGSLARKELIIDMENIKNLLKLSKYCFREGRLQ